MGKRTTTCPPTRTPKQTQRQQTSLHKRMQQRQQKPRDRRRAPTIHALVVAAPSEGHSDGHAAWAGPGCGRAPCQPHLLQHLHVVAGAHGGDKPTGWVSGHHEVAVGDGGGGGGGGAEAPAGRQQDGGQRWVHYGGPNRRESHPHPWTPRIQLHHGALGGGRAAEGAQGRRHCGQRQGTQGGLSRSGSRFSKRGPGVG
jgi:hypothetical protein